MTFDVRRRHVVAAVAALGLAVTARRVFAADTAAVKIDNFTFVPAALTVAAGATVTWTNVDDIPHSIVGADGKFHSRALDTDDAFSYTFASSGTYDYYCGLHPHMTGKIIVTA